MKRIALIVAVALSLVSANLLAADAKTYQVTGPVLEINSTYFVVQKGEDKWQIARNKDTKITGTLKVGAKVTIEYRMVATDVEVKAETVAPEKKK